VRKETGLDNRFAAAGPFLFFKISLVGRFSDSSILPLIDPTRAVGSSTRFIFFKNFLPRGLANKAARAALFFSIPFFL